VWGDCSAQTCKVIIFRTNGTFFGQKPAAKNETIFFVFIKPKNVILSVLRDEMPEIRDFY